MTLSESKFRELMSSFRSDLGDPDEHRRSPRVGVSVRATVLLHKTRRILPVHLRDLSKTGIGFTSEQRIEVGEHFSLLLSKPDGKMTHILYEVRHCHEASDGFHDLGAMQVAAPAPSRSATDGKAPAAAAK